MKQLSEKEKKMFDWDNELRFDSASYSDAQVIEVAQEAIEYAYNNFNENEAVYEDYQFIYERRISNVALGIESHLQDNPSNKKSLLIRKFVMEVINNNKYGRGRNGFIFLLQVLKMDNELRTIATERPDFWHTPRIEFDLLYALYRRKIRGFAEQVIEMIAENPKSTAIKKYGNKYLEQEHKWK